jgi:uncharacterized protein (TIGR02145 family)
MNTNLPPILDFNPDTNKGTLFDTRDGQSYPVVRIGNQIWTAENFRYLPSKEKGDLFDTSCVYDNDVSYLDKGYGRLYDWNTANHIAPEGWKLPSNEDFIELRDFIIKDNNLAPEDWKLSSNEDFDELKNFITKEDNLEDGDKVGSYLKSVNGWAPLDDIVNNDKYGFNAKPAGYIENDPAAFYTGTDANFWSAMDNNRGSNNHWYLYFNDRDFRNLISNDFKKYGFSVRLIKDYEKKKQP